MANMTMPEAVQQAEVVNIKGLLDKAKEESNKAYEEYQRKKKVEVGLAKDLAVEIAKLVGVAIDCEIEYKYGSGVRRGKVVEVAAPRWGHNDSGFDVKAQVIKKNGTLGTAVDVIEGRHFFEGNDLWGKHPIKAWVIPGEEVNDG